MQINDTVGGTVQNLPTNAFQITELGEQGDDGLEVFNWGIIDNLSRLYRRPLVSTIECQSR